METPTLEVTHGTLTQEGSLDVAALDFDILEMEGAIAYHEGMIERSKEAKLPGQAQFHEEQAIIARKMLELRKAGFPQIMGVRTVLPFRGHEFTHGSIRTLANRDRGILTPKRRYYAAFAPSSYTGTNDKGVPIVALESYQRAKAIPELFDTFEIWERALGRIDAGRRVGERRIPVQFPTVEFDPYLVGVVRFVRTEQVRTGGYGGYGHTRTDTIVIAPRQYYLIDRWDEIEPMP